MTIGDIIMVISGVLVTICIVGILCDKCVTFCCDTVHIPPLQAEI